MKAASRGARCLFVAPVQEKLCTNPLPLSDEAGSRLPKATCHTCAVAVPLQLLEEHIKSCADFEILTDDLTSVNAAVDEMSI